MEMVLRLLLVFYFIAGVVPLDCYNPWNWCKGRCRINYQLIGIKCPPIRYKTTTPAPTVSIEYLRQVYSKIYKFDPSVTYDCMDAEDRLTCQVRCPESRQVREKNCPFNRICCYGKPSSVFMPIRRNIPFYKPPSPVSRENSELSISDPIYNYLIKKANKTETMNKHTVTETTTTITTLETTTVETTTPRLDDTYNAVIKIEESDRKSVKYCKIYTNLTYEYSYASPVLPEIIPFAIVMDNCIPIVKPLVVGGKAVVRGEFPHMAAIGFNKTDFIDYLCGGTLISEKHVLTAGHCTNTRWGNPVVVMLGSAELYDSDSIEAEVAKVTTHPDYKPSSYYNDIAILELKEEVKFSQYLRPACLPQPESKAHNYGSITIATGWGKTGAAYEPSIDLLKVLLRIVNSTECQDHYSSISKITPLKEGINENLICAVGYKSKYHDTCQGDSGGPIQTFLPGHKCAFEITGITSFGKMCGTGIPAVYTKVQPYISWIETIVWP